MKRSRVLLATLVILLTTTCIVGQSSSAFACGTGPAVAYGRNQFCGYFANKYDAWGAGCNSGYVLCGGIPNNVDTVQGFINYIENNMNSGSTQDKTGADFIIHTMMGDNANGVATKVPGPQELAKWEDSIKAYGNISENGTVSKGSSGTIRWFSSHPIGCGVYNSYYQQPENDDAFFQETKSSVPACGGANQDFVEFYNTAGTMQYQLRRQCANPVGDSGGITKVLPPYNLVPSVKSKVSSGQTIAVPGDTITFTYAIDNNDPGDSNPATCTEYANTFAGSHGTPGGPNYDKGGTVSTLCSKRVFAADTSVTLKTETVSVTAADINHTLCRTLYVAPASATVASRGAEACVTVQTYALIPTVNDTSSGGDNAFAEVGDTVTFTYTVANTAAGPSHPATCKEYDYNPAGYHAAPNPPAYDTGGTQSTLCTAQVFQGNQTTTLKTEVITVTAAMANTTLCRTLTVAPSSPTVAIMGSEACVPIVNMPYARVFGGDVSAGNAQASATCSSSNDYNAGIVGWNTASGLYNGAGAQFAAFAIGEIAHFATSQTNTGASKGVAPSGLSFANTTTAANGVYGGSLGANSLPCMNDYYVVPAGATDITNPNINLGSLASGAYVYTGPSEPTVSGQLASGVAPQRIQLFVPNQNVYINNNITYMGNWQAISQIPMFELVVKSGNILISSGVNEVDGTYIAQNSAADGKGTGGQIATCATAAGAVVPSVTGSLYTNCNSMLTVNGAFVADDVSLERSAKTLDDSSTDSPTSLTSSAAEQFNYNPSLWLIQPPTTPGALTYNTIVDLPPVL